MKKYLGLCTILLVVIIGDYHYGFLLRNLNHLSIDGEIKQVSRVSDDYFEVYRNNQWQKIFLKGVNMGTTKPGYFPGDFGVSKEDYLRWFEQISEMNANIVRVYTLQSPVFYEALYEHNRYVDEPLYIMHGVWLNEEMMLTEMDAFNSTVTNTFKEEICDIIDAIHGNLNREERKGEAYGAYTKDVSPYVIGYILGTEWDPYFVNSTNDLNEGVSQFNGDYVYTIDANPIEVFFAQMIEHAVAYETNHYQMQRPVAITNWVTTDIIDHQKDLENQNMMDNINVETIKATSSFKSNLFASYHVYPYYPDFLNYDSDYAEYVDEENQVNSYVAYLKKLKAAHHQPIVISEFGVPTSRGITHVDVTRGFNQGMISEQDQAMMNVKMLNEIYDEGYAGALVFSWQDEWFKRTWNTMDLDDESARPHWSDRMTNEEYFGILSFDSGNKNSQIYLDGKVSDWHQKDLISSNDQMKLYMKSDEAYVYFRIHKENLNLEKEELIIPIDVTPYSGSRTIKPYSFTFNRDADFYIHIGENNQASFYVQDYYDVSDFMYDPLDVATSDSDNFNIYTQVVLGKSIHPETGEVIPLQKVEVGRLIEGNSNPKSSDYQSLADYYIGEDEIEIRIPWLMLNIANPTQKLIIGDVYSNQMIKHEEVSEIYVGCYIQEHSDEDVLELPMASYTWSKWEDPTYFERLKPVYYALKDAFLKLN